MPLLRLQSSERKFTMSREIEPVRRSFRRRRSCTFTEVARWVPSGSEREISKRGGSNPRIIARLSKCPRTAQSSQGLDHPRSPSHSSRFDPEAPESDGAESSARCDSKFVYTEFFAIHAANPAGADAARLRKRRSWWWCLVRHSSAACFSANSRALRSSCQRSSSCKTSIALLLSFLL